MGALCSVHKPLPRKKEEERTPCLKPFWHQPKNSKMSAVHRGRVVDSAGNRDLSSDPEDAEMGLWTVP